MEILRRGRAIGNPDVAFGRELQETLKARARMLGTPAFITVRQEQRQARGLTPLGHTRSDKLIHDDLRTVHKIAELRFPQYERASCGGAVAVFEAEAGVLRERTVPHLERGLGFVEMLDRRIPLAAIRIGVHEMAVAERSAFGILSRKADGRPIGDERRKRQCFRQAPIDFAVALDGLCAAFKLAQKLGIDREARRYA